MGLDYEAVFRKSPAPEMVLDRDLKFVAANPAYLQMVGKTEEDLLGVYVFDAFPESRERVETMANIFREGLRGGEPMISEIPFSIPINGVLTEQWWTARHAGVEDADGETYVIQFSENVTEQVKTRQMRNALLGEVQHRVGNIFAIVGATARRVAARSSDVDGFMEEFEDRLDALVHVNRKMTGAGEENETIGSIIDFQLNAHAQDALEKVSANGPDFPLSVLQAQAISMAVHELATNSVKYGVLGQEGGRLTISWSSSSAGGGGLRWRETGIVAPKRKKREGHGSMLLNTIIPDQLGGASTREFGRGSFTYSLEFGRAG